MPQTNLTQPAPNGNLAQNIFGWLGNVATQLGGVVVDNQIALSNGKTQAKLNQYHAQDPSTGPNNPQAAQVYANKTLLDRYLPTSFIYSKDASGNQVFGIGYYISIGLLIAGFVWLLKKV